MSIRAAIFARWPEAGQCKTRLIPALGAKGAAAVHKKLTERTLATVRESDLTPELWGTGASGDAFEDWLGPITFHEQGEGDLGQRLTRALDPAPVILLGTDIPDLSRTHLHAAAAALKAKQFVIGPAHDGGYYFLGLPKPMPELFRDMPWGGPKVFSETRTRLKSAGENPAILEPLHDLDRPEDLARWPEISSWAG